MQNNCDILTPSLRKYIEENLGKTTLNKIEQRLIERHGMGLGQAIKEFSKLDEILKEIFGAGAVELESRFIQNNIIEQSTNNVENWSVLKELLVSTIQKSIEDNLGKETLNKIESRLMELHHFSVSQSIEEFTKFDGVLREFFGAGATGLESRFIQNIIKTESLKKGFGNLTFQEQSLAKKFLKPFSENDKKTLLESFSIKQLA
jgi:RNase P/RNase MRP subunit POP5